jgi:hypothetical protein
MGAAHPDALGRDFITLLGGAAGISEHKRT